MTAADLLAANAEELAERPYLRAFIEDDDHDLRPAERRWEDCQRRTRLALRARGVELHSRVRTPTGLTTTALAVETDQESR